MKSAILYLDCPGGVSGDMLLASLSDGLISMPEVLKQLRRDMPFFKKLEAQAVQVEKYGLPGKQLKIRFRGEEKEPARTFPIIKKMIESSKLPAPVKKRALSVFLRIAVAEGKIHNLPLKKVHFHELSAADTLFDVIAFCLAIHLLNVEQIYCSPLPMGSGTVTFSHGTWPLPAPATLAILGDIPVYAVGALGELVTPTGAALVKEFVSQFGHAPVFQIEKMGQGFGTANRPARPNVLRAMLGQRVSRMTNTETILELVTVVDDVSGVVVGHTIDRLRAQGALDAYVTAVQMKKNRPGFEIHVLCDPRDMDLLNEVLFQETGTLGIRIYPVERVTLSRSSGKTKRKGFEVEIKTVKSVDGKLQHRPEYESLKEIARHTHLPFKHVHEAVK